MKNRVKSLLVILSVLGAVHGCKTQKPPVHGTILVPDDFPTIQEALDFAWSGDTVLVAPGNYFDPIKWPSIDSIVLLSASGPDSTWISGKQATGITISTGIGSTTVISGFKISGGHGGIRCYNSSPTISSNIFTLSSADSSGGGIYCKNSDPIISNNIITGNSTESSGGGIYCTKSSPKIIDNIITNNTANCYGGAIYCYQSNATISGNTISQNASLDQGCHLPDLGSGSILVWGGSPIITTNDIVDNDRRGIWLYGSHSTITYNTITDHEIAGLVMQLTYASISYNIISNNNAGIGTWGDVGWPKIHHNNIVGNHLWGATHPPYWMGCAGILNVEHNWWGSSSGPGGEGPGTGDKVTECVDYNPWLASPVDIDSHK